MQHAVAPFRLSYILAVVAALTLPVLMGFVEYMYEPVLNDVPIAIGNALFFLAVVAVNALNASFVSPVRSIATLALLLNLLALGLLGLILTIRLNASTFLWALGIGPFLPLCILSLISLRRSVIAR